MSNQIPDQFICPITNEVMVDPVIDPDGNSYERNAIIAWLQTRQTSPITRNLLLPTQLTPNRALRNLIDAYRQVNPEVFANYTADSKDAKDWLDLKDLKDGAKEIAEGKHDDESKADGKEAEDEIPHRKPIMLYAVIDTSGSMQESCGGNATENDGYTRLDLVKHTFNTLVTALSAADYACVIKFSTVADVFIPLTKLTKANKKILIEKLKHLEPENQTNLWDGLRLAIDEIAGLGDVTDNYNVQVYVLTDGEPNINPPGAISDVLKNHLDRKCRHAKPVINTFGYGYNLDSDMLFSISKVSNGFFGFIPDATMVGTVFINALSNSTVTGKAALSDIAESVCVEFVTVLYNVISARDIDNRTLLLSRFNRFLDQADVHAEQQGGNLHTIDFIYNLKSDCSPSGDPNLGQISKAIESQYFNHWGKHYLRSVLSAYLNRVCINFKDKGIQHFKTEQFIDEQKRIESIFVQLPPPRPSGAVGGYRGGYGGGYGTAPGGYAAPAPVNMANYYDASGGCFTDDSSVFVIENGQKKVVKFSELQKGSEVLSKDGVTSVEAIVKIKYHGSLYQIGEMKLTAFHPVMMNDGSEFFPVAHPTMKKIDNFDGYVYDVVLKNRSLLAAMYDSSNTFFVATFGHNVKSEVFSHDYFGSDLIVKDLQASSMWSKGYIVSEKPVYHRDNVSQKVVKISW